MRKTLLDETDYIGKTFRKNITVESRVENTGKVVCRCICGNTFIEYISNIVRGGNTSCGCLKRDRVYGMHKHGMKKSLLYNTWVGMRERCHNPNCKSYKHYGGKGIKICDRWMDHEKGFINFLNDVGERPSKNHSLDRGDNDLGYSPDNCYWATRLEQMNNRSDTVWIEYRGEKRTIRDWSDKLGIKIRTIKGRLARGLSPEDIFEKPIRKSNIGPKFSGTEEDIIAIFVDCRSQVEIAKSFGCSKLTVSKIQYRELYANITKHLESKVST